MYRLRNKIIAAIVILVIAAGAYAVGAGSLFVPQRASAAPVVQYNAAPVQYNPALAQYSQDTVTSIYDSASPAVVEIDIVAQGTGFRSQSSEALGSGFLIDTNGNIVTNNHVVSGATSVKVVLKNGNTVDARVVGTDAANDLAVISVDPSAVAGITPLQFGDSSTLKPGQMAIAIGNPYGLDSTITVGVISGLNRSISGSNYTGMLQTDAAINPGNSGGPLLDANGMVIGINTAIESPSTGAVGIGFAIPSSVVQRIVPDLIAGKQITRPWLGITGAALTPTLAQNFGLTVSQGVYVVAVTQGGPAGQAGLIGGGSDATGAPTKGGDVITAIDGHPVTGVPDLSSYLNTRRVGNAVSLTILRNGNTSNIQVTLGTFPANPTTAITPPATPAPQPQPRIPGYNRRGG